MSFFHVLPSNVALDSFPENSASSFSTPIPHVYHLEGKWEVALMNITYGACINTFHNDVMTVDRDFSLKRTVLHSEKPIRLHFSANNFNDLISKINLKLDGVLNIEKEKNDVYKWILESSDCVAILSKALTHRFGLKQHVITSWIRPLKNEKPVEKAKVWEDTDYHIIIIPPNFRKTTIVLKESNKKMTSKELVETINSNSAGSFQLVKAKNGNRFSLTKLKDDNALLLFSPSFIYLTSLVHTGFYQKGEWNFTSQDFSIAIKMPMHAYLYQLNDIEEERGDTHISLTLPNRAYETRQEAVAALNKAVDDDDITFSLLKNVLQLNIKNEKKTVTFSNTLRDIFAFNQNTYNGKGSFTADDVFSLTRRIHYLYIYSSISDYIRIGNTEAPLLAVIPFNPGTCNNRLREVSFKTPMYVGVSQKDISQIDIGIYDDAGHLVPFVTDSVSSLRLHFRKL